MLLGSCSPPWFVWDPGTAAAAVTAAATAKASALERLDERVMQMCMRDWRRCKEFERCDCITSVCDGCVSLKWAFQMHVRSVVCTDQDGGVPSSAAKYLQLHMGICGV
jgi:hypothetical protein